MLGINVSRHTEIVPKKYSEVRKTPRYGQTRASNYDFRQNIFVGINVSRQTEIVLKKYAPGRKDLRYRKKRASNYDFRQIFLLGINVSRHTETVPKNVISGSKNPQEQSKPRYIIVMISVKILSWASTSRGTPK